MSIYASSLVISLVSPCQNEYLVAVKLAANIYMRGNGKVPRAERNNKDTRGLSFLQKV